MAGFSVVNAQSNKDSEKENGSDKKTESVETKKEEKSENKKSTSETVECDPNSEWKNHGEYVSCVAKQKQGGQTVSEAAQSSIGKRSFIPAPTASASASPSATPIISPEPSATESASESGTLIEQGTDVIVEGFTTVVNSIAGFFGQIQSFFSF